MTELIDWDRVARYYDAYVTTTYDVPFFLKQARAAGGPILEVMCGTGRIALPLLEDGLEVTGVDRSGAQTAVFRRKLAQRNLLAEVVDADARTFELGRRFRLVFVGFHAFAEIRGEADRAQAFRRMCAHLEPGGRLIITLHNPVVRKTAVHEEWKPAGPFPIPGSDNRIDFLSRWQVTSAGRSISGEQRYIEKRPDGTVVHDESLPIEFDLVERAEVEQLGTGEGLTLVALYGDYDESPFDPASSRFMLFVFERPDTPR